MGFESAIDLSVCNFHRGTIRGLMVLSLEVLILDTRKIIAGNIPIAAVFILAISLPGCTSGSKDSVIAKTIYQDQDRSLATLPTPFTAPPAEIDAFYLLFLREEAINGGALSRRGLADEGYSCRTFLLKGPVESVLVVIDREQKKLSSLATFDRDCRLTKYYGRAGIQGDYLYDANGRLEKVVVRALGPVLASYAPCQECVTRDRVNAEYKFRYNGDHMLSYEYTDYFSGDSHASYFESKIGSQQNEMWLTEKKTEVTGKTEKEMDHFIKVAPGNSLYIIQPYNTLIQFQENRPSVIKNGHPP